MTVLSRQVPKQRLLALQRANMVRADGAAVKREVAAGVLPVVEAFDDPRARRLEVAALLLACPYRGPVKTRTLLVRQAISGHWRVGDLTGGQRERLLRALSGRRS